VQSRDAECALSLIQSTAQTSGVLLAVLHRLQEEFGYIDEAAIPLIAETLNIPVAEAHVMVSVYQDVRMAPHGRVVLQVCRAESCQTMGCEVLIQHLENRLGIRLGEAAADATFIFRSVYCLGNCSSPPSIMLNDKVYSRVSPEVADFLADIIRGRP